ncbi:MAG: cytidine deaminase [Clostridia bacterium]|nr:cytidine deaminase [Clostridia bacterium]
MSIENKNAAITPTELIDYAKQAMKKAYCPYSGYKVGAALLTKDGRVFTGCNIENASFTPTVCAERTAFFKAISEGNTDFSAIAIVGGKDGVISGVFPPCGVCRQVMSEFCDPRTFKVYLGTETDEYKSLTLAELLPYGFSKSNVNI